MGRAGKEHPAACLAAAVLLMCSLAPPADCLGLRKSLRQVATREAGVREGKIVFGDVFKVLAGTRKTSSNASVDDEADYQADFAGWSKHTDMDEPSQEKWNSLATSLHCFGDHMKFRSLGPEASHLSVMQAKEHPVPLSMLPPRCGYRIHVNTMLLIMIVPYHGCHMLQQGGNYVLPLLWQDHPLSLTCPKWPQVPQAPYFDFYSHLFPSLAEPAPQYKFPLYPYPPQSTAPPPTKVPIPLPPYLPSQNWHQFPELPPFLPYPTEKYPVAPTSRPKMTTSPYTPTASPATQESQDFFNYELSYESPAASPTAEPKVPYPQIPFDPYFPWQQWPQFPVFPPTCHYPPEKCPKVAMTPRSPAQWYPMDYPPLIPNQESFEQMFYPQHG
ncbi:leucine-rich repeat extensin-like protein 1 isoform X5 [Fundulus heteroclitus]|uniref:leucine-rich repeat extensin-like protein 1 isoform X5 n=1 Tax=Fundulus heteroclitus TaxID=8078 RepID=UPI00165CD7FF|nr:leucine-rich repeat extensin-like protein 1 isoform X5 [Fundulus heteroclitus]